MKDSTQLAKQLLALLSYHMCFEKIHISAVCGPIYKLKKSKIIRILLYFQICQIQNILIYIYMCKLAVSRLRDKFKSYFFVRFKCNIFH